MDNVTTLAGAVGTTLILDALPSLDVDPITGKFFVTSLGGSNSVSELTTWQLVTMVTKTATNMNNITSSLVFIAPISI